MKQLVPFCLPSPPFLSYTQFSLALSTCIPHTFACLRPTNFHCFNCRNKNGMIPFCLWKVCFPSKTTFRNTENHNECHLHSDMPPSLFGVIHRPVKNTCYAQTAPNSISYFIALLDQLHDFLKEK